MNFTNHDDDLDLYYENTHYDPLYQTTYDDDNYEEYELATAVVTAKKLKVTDRKKKHAQSKRHSTSRIDYTEKTTQHVNVQLFEILRFLEWTCEETVVKSIIMKMIELNIRIEHDAISCSEFFKCLKDILNSDRYNYIIKNSSNAAIRDFTYLYSSNKFPSNRICCFCNKVQYLRTICGQCGKESIHTLNCFSEEKLSILSPITSLPLIGHKEIRNRIRKDSEEMSKESSLEKMSVSVARKSIIRFTQSSFNESFLTNDLLFLMQSVAVNCSNDLQALAHLRFRKMTQKRMKSRIKSHADMSWIDLSSLFPQLSVVINALDKSSITYSILHANSIVNPNPPSKEIETNYNVPTPIVLPCEEERFRFIPLLSLDNNLPSLSKKLTKLLMKEIRYENCEELMKILQYQHHNKEVSTEVKTNDISDYEIIRHQVRKALQLKIKSKRDVYPIDQMMYDIFSSLSQICCEDIMGFNPMLSELPKQRNMYCSKCKNVSYFDHKFDIEENNISKSIFDTKDSNHNSSLKESIEFNNKTCTTCHIELEEVLDYEFLTEALVWLYIINHVTYGHGHGHDTIPKLSISELPPLVSIFQYFPYARNYLSFDILGNEMFLLQCYFITHFIFVLSDWGEIKLSSKLCQEEVDFIVENMQLVISNVKDPDIVGEFIYCLKIFGFNMKDKNPLIRNAIIIGQSFLLDLEKKFSKLYGGQRGIFRDDCHVVDSQESYHATYCAILGLMNKNMDIQHKNLWNISKVVTQI